MLVVYVIGLCYVVTRCVPCFRFTDVFLFATFSFPLSSLQIPSDAALLSGGYCFAGIFIMQ